MLPQHNEVFESFPAFQRAIAGPARLTRSDSDDLKAHFFPLNIAFITSR